MSEHSDTPLRVNHGAEMANGNGAISEAQKARDTEPAEKAAAGAAAAGGPPAGGPPKLEKYAYGFFDPQMAMFRKITFKILGPSLVLTICLMWLGLPLYWGSLWKSNKYTNRLTVRVIDRDGGDIGSAVSQSLLAFTNLKYFTTSPSEFPTTESLEDNIVNEGAWAAVVINSGATAALALAQSIGNTTYNGTSAISVYYSQARNENAAGSYLVPYLQQALGSITGQLSAKNAAQYLQANANNATAINLLATAPSTISNSISYQMVNLRPYNQPVATAITLVGLIYMLIFAFTITMTNNAVREIIGPFMTTKAYLTYRVATPLILYLPVSFLFAMVSLPFKAHFGAHYTYAGGFFLWAFTLYLGMSAVGLATEFAVTLLGQKFTAFFLIPWILVNVSVATLPHELQPWIYRYGAAMPFYNVGRAVRTIIFNTRNEIAQNLGILLGWVGLSIITITVTTYLLRRKAVQEHRREQMEAAKDQEKQKRPQMPERPYGYGSETLRGEIEL